MAKATQPVTIVRVPKAKLGASGDGEMEIRFGKTDRIIKLPYPADNPTNPNGVVFIGRSGRVHIADFSAYPGSIRDVLVFHGAKQKLGDEYADLDNEDDCFEAMIALDGRLAKGQWTAERQGFSGVSVLMRAIMQVFGLTEEKAREFLKPLSKVEKDALRVSPELKPAIDEIEKAKGKGADVTGLIEKLQQA
jgi:hypothetical protein